MQRKNIAEATANIIDGEIRRLIDDADNKARAIINEQLDKLHVLAKGLLEYETLTGDEINALMRGETILRPEEKDEDQPPQQDTSGGRSPIPSTGQAKGAGKGKPGDLNPEPQPGS